MKFSIEKIKNSIILIILSSALEASAGKVDYGGVGVCIGITHGLYMLNGQEALDKSSDITKGILAKYGDKYQNLMKKIGQCYEYYESRGTYGSVSREYFEKCGVKLSKIDLEIAIGLVQGMNAVNKDPKGAATTVNLICFASTGG